jgi:hypothetical protein
MRLPHAIVWDEDIRGQRSENLFPVTYGDIAKSAWTYSIPNLQVYGNIDTEP